MKKIPSLFERPEGDLHGICIDKITPGCEWVINGEGRPTAKLDGSACAVINGKLYKRFDNSMRKGDERIQKTEPLEDWIHCGDTSERGKFIYWIPITSQDYYHQNAWEYNEGKFEDGTYELVGPKVQGNPHGFRNNLLIKHGEIGLGTSMMNECPRYGENPRNYEDIKRYLEVTSWEGIVWHHEDGRMCKITKSKFGLPWNGKTKE